MFDKLQTDLVIILSALGGVGLFLFGMEQVTRGLLATLGPNLRRILQQITGNRATGFLGGTAISTLLTSAPTTVMVVGFVNAGMITLVQAIPIIIGANVGTTIAMQFIAFNLQAYALAVVGISFILRLVVRNEFAKHLASVILGVGLLFVGLGLLQSSLAPLKASTLLQGMLARSTAETVGGLLFGVLISAVFTSLLMSSNAMIAVTFALANLGVFSNLTQVFPIILGVRIGTCVMTLTGAIGTGLEARRTAASHLLFNLFGTVIAIALMPLYLKVIPHTSANLTRQIANTSTAVQIVNAIIFLPFVGVFAKFLEKILPSRGPEAEGTYLDPRMVRTPELAILMAVKEMRRQARISQRMLKTSMEALITLDLSRFNEVRQDEESVDQIKKALDSYFVAIAGRQLSRRQSVMLQHLVASSNDIERIADHIENIAVLTTTKVKRKIWFEDESMLRLLTLADLVGEIMALTVDSLDTSAPNHRDFATAQLERRKEYKRLSAQVREQFNNRIFEGAEDALNGMFYMRYITVFDRIIRHVRGIARTELQEAFLIEEDKLDLEVPRSRQIRVPPARIEDAELFVEGRRN
ncbi:Na/Pi cotransporter family protein [soil metagenome]